MKTHQSTGVKILANSRAEILQFAHQIAISHHKKWNGMVLFHSLRLKKQKNT
jgi:response regulator RpfG family c-di-GMP phosphodiesterase